MLSHSISVMHARVVGCALLKYIIMFHPERITIIITGNDNNQYTKNESTEV